MGAIVLDASKVKSYVLPSLVKSKNTVQDAYSTSVNLKNTLPSSFRYRNMVNDIVNQLYNIKREINDVNTIIEKKIEKAKTIETKNDNRASKISSMVSKIGPVGGTIGGAMVGAATMGVTGAVVGGVVGSKVGKTIADTGAKVASKVVSGVKKLGTSIVDGFKWIGAKVSSGVKSATNWISDKAKKVSDWVSEKFDVVKDWTSKALKDTGAWISKTAKATWSWLKDTASTVWTHIKKIGASIANVVISFVKGLVKLVEAIGDLVILLGAGIGTIGTALYDIGKGIITGNWDWGATKGLWDGTKSVVAYDWTSKCLFDPLYRTEFGKWLDNNAYSPFKSDGMACKISEGIGYVAGVIVLTICTFGVGGVAVGSAATVSAGVSATTLAATATAAGIGKYTEEEWNKNSISINYGGTDLDIAIDYEKYSEIEKLKQGQSTTLTHQLTLEDGTIQELTFKITAKGNGKYDITDGYGNVAVLNNLNESSTAKGLLVGTVKGAWEGAQWYVGGKIGAGQFTKITGKVTSPIMKKITTSGVRVALDMGTGVVEVPFQSLVTMASEGKTWNEAWQSQGGWDAVKMQAGIAGLASFGGEALDISKFLKNQKNITKNVNLTTKAPRPSNLRSNGSTIEETLLDIIKVHDAKYGEGTALMSLTALVDPTNQYYGKYSIITSDGNARAALKYYSTDQIEHALYNLSTNSPTPSSFFTRVGNAAENTYGVDQGGIAALCEYTYNGQKYTYRQAMDMTNDAIKNGYPAPHFKKEATMEYFNLKNKLINQGFSSKDASIIMSTVDDAGACSYASTANEIFTAFKGKEDEFYEKFGYNMYKTNKYGQTVLNSNELLLDLYVYCNKAENGGGFILGNNTLNPYLLADRYDVFGRQMLDAKNQVYMSSSNSGKNLYAVESFLNSKGVDYNSNWIVRNDSSNYINYNFLNIVDSELKAGNSVTLDIYSYGNEIHMNSTNPNIYNSLTTNSWREGGGHSVFITGMGKDCFYVSSWGQEYSIPYSDLANGGMFNIFSAKIN